VGHHVPGSKGRRKRRFISSLAEKAEVTEIILPEAAPKATTSTESNTPVFQVEVKLPNYRDMTLPKALAATAYRRRVF